MFLRHKKKNFFKRRKFKKKKPQFLKNRFFFKKSFFFSQILTFSLFINKFLLAPVVLATQVQIYGFLLFYNSLLSVYPTITLIVIHSNTTFLFYIYSYLYNLLLKYR